MREHTYARAINYALADAMQSDPSVYLIGQDIGYGGVYGVTAGLRRDFGVERVLDAPIAENLILGHAVGASLLGRKPVVEMQFADFVSVGFPVLTQLAASFRYRTGRGLPLVVRLPYGSSGRSGGPFHSQSPEMWFLNIPGFKVVAPSTPADAYGLLRTAINDPDPVLFLEHKRLYQGYKGHIPEPGEEGEFVPFGQASVWEQEKNCLIVSYGWGSQLIFEVMDLLDRGLEPNVTIMDLRTLIPLDKEQLTTLASKIGKVIIVHEAPREWGPGGWLSQVIHEADPKVRVEVIGAKYSPPPYSPILEKAYLPSVDDVANAVRRLIRS